MASNLKDGIDRVPTSSPTPERGSPQPSCAASDSTSAPTDSALEVALPEPVWPKNYGHNDNAAWESAKRRLGPNATASEVAELAQQIKDTL